MTTEAETSHLTYKQRKAITALLATRHRARGRENGRRFGENDYPLDGTTPFSG